MKDIIEKTAWEIAGDPDLFYRSYLYKGKQYECIGVSRGENTVRFARLVTTKDHKLKQINIWIKPDTKLIMED